MTAALDPDILEIATPRWALPLLEPARYKGAKGGRSSGKSHFFAEALVERLVYAPDEQWVCIREIQKSLKFSAKKTIENKIKALDVGHLFEITLTEIRRRGYDGIIIFQGMQDHTAESIKSLEGFDGAWVEEAQSLSHRSLELLVPTIRKPGSELWFTWNPDQPEDAVEVLFANNPKAILVHVNYMDNPWCPEDMVELAEWQRAKDYERYAHIWLGAFNTKSEAQIFLGRWRVAEFEPDPDTWDGPYQGGDFGFSKDPTCAVRCWIKDNVLYIEYDPGKVGLDLDMTVRYFQRRIPGFKDYLSYFDSARPESISYLKKPKDAEGRPKPHMPKIRAVKKWSNSVEDGVEFLKTFEEIVIHTRCKDMQEEARLYCYKVDKNTGEPTNTIADDHNHRWDSVRYALSPMIRQGKKAGVFLRK